MFNSLRGINRYTVLVLSILLTLFSAVVTAEGCTGSSGAGQYESLAASLKAFQPVKLPNRDLLGVDLAYWLDADQAWLQAGLGEKLHAANIATVRYPGGEVADNFDWETTGVDRPGQFPGDAPAAQRLSYRELLDYAGKAGITNFFFIVNVEGAFFAAGDRDENIRRYAEKAARWVADVKRHGYKVKYWEIGNEPYLAVTSYPLSAAEYAKVLNVFYRAMKQADPSIRIGAAGPDRVRKLGFSDKLTMEQRQYFHSARPDGTNACKANHMDGKSCVEWIRSTVPGVAEPVPWWDVILENARDSFDFVAVHHYGLTRKAGAARRAQHFADTKKTENLRSYLEQKAGHPIELAVTEWNVTNNKKSKIFVDETDAALDNATKLGNYVAGGVDYAILWPMRYQDNDYRALLTFDSLAPTLTYKTFQLMAPILAGGFVDQANLDSDVYLLQTQWNNGRGAMFVNRGSSGKLVSVALNTTAANDVEVTQLEGLTSKNGVLCAKSGFSSGALDVSLPPKSVTVLKAVAH